MFPHCLPSPDTTCTPRTRLAFEFQAKRSPTGSYRTAPLKGLFAHQKGGFYHDGPFPTIRAVVDHYDTFLKTGLTEEEKNDLVAYLRTL